MNAKDVEDMINKVRDAEGQAELLANLKISYLLDFGSVSAIVDFSKN